MSYIGQGPFQEFTNPPTKDSFTGDGSTTTFDLNSEVPSGSQNALEAVSYTHLTLPTKRIV